MTLPPVAKMTARHTARGFSLLELIIAIALTAVVTGMMAAALSNMSSSLAWQQDAGKPINELRHVMQLLEADLQNLSPRPIRNERREVEAAVLRDVRSDLYLVQFTRGGYSNPAHATRSTLQRVAYRVKDEQLQRLTWPQLDRASYREPREQVLLQKVDNVKIRFLDKNNRWSDSWPPRPRSSSEQVDPKLLPKATELIVTVPRFGEVRRVFSGVLP